MLLENLIPFLEKNVEKRRRLFVIKSSLKYVLIQIFVVKFCLEIIHK